MKLGYILMSSLAFACLSLERQNDFNPPSFNVISLTVHKNLSFPISDCDSNRKL